MRRVCLKAALCAAFAGFVCLGSPLSAQVAQRSGAADPMVQRNITDWAVQGKGLPDDWTHHHLVFSNPGTEQEAIANGTYEKWLKVAGDPRFTMQQIKRAGGAKAVADSAVSGAVPSSIASPALVHGPPGPRGNPGTPIKKDWNVALGGAAAHGVGTVTTNNASGTTPSSVTVSTQTFTASPLVAEVGTLTEGQATGSYPPNSTSLGVGTITYNFSNATLGTSPAAGNCNVYTDDSRSTTYTNLYAAMTNSTTAHGTTTWECASGATPNTAVSTVLTTNNGSGHVITLTSATAGTTGAFTPTVGSTGIVWAVTMAASDGTNTTNSFQYWSSGAALSQTAVAANIAAAINLNSFAFAASSSGNVVTVTSNTPGTAANGTALDVANFSGFSWGTGVTSMSGGAAGATVQPNMFPAKYSFSTTSASCNDYVVYPTGTQGSTGAASIVAFNNLYPGSSCLTSGGTAPISWAYNTGGMATTSPVLSQDGTQVAFIQVSSSGVASLVILTPVPGGGGTPTLPVTPTATTSSTYNNCTAPCMLVLPFGNSANDTFSAPFYSYDYDNIYVGDDSGNLHEFTGVFLGNPAEAGSPWPVNLSSLKLSIPVYDKTSGLVFVGDIGTTTTAALHSVNAATGVVNATWNGSATGKTMGDAIADAPLVDSSSETVYAFVTTSGSYSETGDNAVYEFPAAFTSATAPGVEPVGTGGDGLGYYLYDSSFDNLFYSGAPFGNLYVVGNTGTLGGATLYQIPVLTPGSYTVTGTTTSGNKTVTITSGTVPAVAGTAAAGISSTGYIPSGDTIASSTGTSVTMATAATASHTGATITITVSTQGMAGSNSVVTGLNSTSRGWASPTTEFCNNGASACTVSGGETTVGTDYMFFSVYRGAKGGTCSTSTGNGCVMSYSVNNPSATPTLVGLGNVTAVTSNGCWATSGLVVDSASGETGDSEVYFVGLGTNNAGGESGVTSTSCTTGTATTIGATQALQVTP